ncbi:MAG: hypothetical protein LC624_08410 [Halobacteriales archaeon]|nr:hypothetical protein [Halobacteriales archaeon]
MAVLMSMTVGVVMSPQVAASTTLFSENWDSTTIGSPFCTVNSGTSYVCSSVDADELLGTLLILGTSDKFLNVESEKDQPLSSSAPHISQTFNQPSGTANYTVSGLYEAGSASGPPQIGDFVLYQLVDTHGVEILQLGMRIANEGHLQITDNNGTNGMRTTTYTPSTSWRNYIVTVDPVSGKYDLNVYNGGSLDFSATQVAYKSAADGMAVKIVMGSLSGADTYGGNWNDMSVIQ